MRKNLALLFCVLFFVGCGGQESGLKISGTAQENLKLLPAESNLVLFADFQKIKETRFARQFLTAFNERIKEQSEENFEAFKAATGLDPEQDFHNILIGSVMPERRSEQKAFAIIKGDFDEERIISFIRNKAREEHRELPWQEKSISGKTVYLMKDSRNKIGICFVDNNTLFLGPESWLQAALSGDVKESLMDRPEYLNNLVQNVKYGDQLWMALDAKTISGQGGSFANSLRRSMPAFDRVESVVFSAKANSEIDFNGMLLCDSKESGQVMVDLMKGALAAAKLAVSAERAKVDELNKIEVFQDGKFAVLEGELSDEFFKALQEHRLYKWNEF